MVALSLMQDFFSVDSYYRDEKKNATTKDPVQLADFVGVRVLLYHLMGVLYIGWQTYCHYSTGIFISSALNT